MDGLNWLEELNTEEVEELADKNYCEALRIGCPSIGHHSQHLTDRRSGF